VDWGNWEGSVVDGGNWEVISGNSESQIISNIVDSVDSSLINISVRSGDTSIGISLFLLGRVDVLVSVSNVAELILSLELRADWASDRGSNRSSGISNRGSGISSWGSGIRSISSWGSSISNWGSGISSRGGGESWGIGSSVLSSNNWGGSSKSRGSSNGASGQGTSIEGSDGSAVGKSGINTVGNWTSKGMSIGRSIASNSSTITISPVVKTGTSQVLGGNRELSLGGSSSENGRDNSLKVGFKETIL